MPVLKIFRGYLADKLYTEKESIKVKTKQLRVKKSQMQICKRDLEELKLAIALVAAAKQQMKELTNISDFIDFINGETYDSVEAATLFSTIDPNADITDYDLRYSNLFVQFNYLLNNTNNTDYEDDHSNPISLNEWYVYQYNKAQEEYYELYAEIGAHQINIYKIANDAAGQVDVRRGEVDLVLSIAKEISNNVSKLIDLATNKLSSDSDELNKINKDLQDEIEQSKKEYKENISEDSTPVATPIVTNVPSLHSGSKFVTLDYGQECIIILTTAIPGIWKIDAEQSANYELAKNLISIKVTSNNSLHTFTIKNVNKTGHEIITLTELYAIFVPKDENATALKHYNILTNDGKVQLPDNSNLICGINILENSPKELQSVKWNVDLSTTVVNESTRDFQTYFVDETYLCNYGETVTYTQQLELESIVAFDEYNNIRQDWNTTPGSYKLYFIVGNGIQTEDPLNIVVE